KGLPLEDLAEPARDDLHVGLHVLLGPQLPADGGHPAAVDPAGDDPLERLQVVVDVDREAVRGHSPADVPADRADLATLRWPTADPDAGKTIDHLRLDAAGGERTDHQPLEPVDVV